MFTYNTTDYPSLPSHTEPEDPCVFRRILPPVFPKCFNHILCLDNKILKEGVGADSPNLSLK